MIYTDDLPKKSKKIETKHSLATPHPTVPRRRFPAFGLAFLWAWRRSPSRCVAAPSRRASPNAGTAGTGRPKDQGSSAIDALETMGPPISPRGMVWRNGFHRQNHGSSMVQTRGNKHVELVCPLVELGASLNSVQLSDFLKWPRRDVARMMVVGLGEASTKEI